MSDILHFYNMENKYLGNATLPNINIIPQSVLQAFLISIVITNVLVFLFSIGWLVKICLETIKLKSAIKNSRMENLEQIEIRKNLQIVYRRNLILISGLLVEALHLFIKGIGYAMFFYFSFENSEKFGFIIDCNRLDRFYILAFKYFPITLARIGISNSLILFLAILLSIVMIYLSNAYNEHEGLKFMMSYLIFGIIQFFIVWITGSVFWTGFEGTIIFSISVIINCVILFKARNKLSIALFRWKNDAELYGDFDMDSLRRREKIVKSSNRWTYTLVLSFTMYLIAIILDNFANWILMIIPNPCLVKSLFGFQIPEPSLTTLRVTLNLATFLFLLSDVGTFQFDLFLIFSSLFYLIMNNCYITTAYQDRIIRENVRSMIDEQHSTINRLQHN